MNDSGTLPTVLDALVAAERTAPTASSQVRDELRDRLLLTHGNPVLIASAPASLAPAAATGIASSLSAKLMVIAVVAAGAFGVGVWVGTTRSGSAARVMEQPELTAPVAPTASATAAPDAVAPSLPTVVTGPALKEPIASVAPTASDAPAIGRRVRKEIGETRIRKPGREPAGELEPAATASRESQLLREAWADYEARDFDAALRAVDAHEAEFAAGVLAQERDALRIRIFVDTLRDDEAMERIEEFDRSYPDSLHAPAVRRSLSNIQRRNEPISNNE